MKHNVFIVLGVALGLTSMIASGRTMQEIDRSGVLRIGIPGDYAPLAYHNAENTLQGFDVDMAEALAKSLNLKAQFVITSWPTIAQDLSADKFDIAMGGITETPERKKDFNLSSPVLSNGKIALANCINNTAFNSLDKIDTPAVKVAVNPGGTNQIFVNTHIKNAQVTLKNNNLESLDAIRNKTADIMFTDLIEGGYYQSSEPGVFCLATTEPFPGTLSNKIYMTQKNNPKLLEKINIFLKGTDEDALIKKWNVSQIN